MTIPDSLADLRVPIGRLKPYGKNPRRGNVDTIAESLQTNGQYRPIVVNRRTDEVLAGNHTLEAARSLGWTEIAATYVDADLEQAARIVLVDNRSNDVAGYDETALAELLDELGTGNLAGTGFDDAELQQLLAAAGDAPTALTDPDDVPLAPETPVSSVGDVWLLGPHRLTVGDATEATVVQQACGEVAALVVTDPPYNVDYTGAGGLTITNDAMSDNAFADFLREAYAAMLTAVVDGGPIYVFHASSGGNAFQTAMTEAGWAYKQTLIWVKDRMVLSRQDYHWQHEPILYGWKPGAAHRWYGGFTPTTVVDDQRDLRELSKAELLELVDALYADADVLREDRPNANVDHPTMKPVALLTRLIEHSSRPGDLVVDPFGGSGSTLIAAHGCRRRAALVELDPRYADVTCRRWQEHTGQTPVLEATGEAHDFT